MRAFIPASNQPSVYVVSTLAGNKWHELNTLIPGSGDKTARAASELCHLQLTPRHFGRVSQPMQTLQPLHPLCTYYVLRNTSPSSCACGATLLISSLVDARPSTPSAAYVFAFSRICVPAAHHRATTRGNVFFVLSSLCCAICHWHRADTESSSISRLRLPATVFVSPSAYPFPSHRQRRQHAFWRSQGSHVRLHRLLSAPWPGHRYFIETVHLVCLPT